MPELPDVTLDVEALERRLRGAQLERVSITSPNLLHTVTPPPAAAQGGSEVVVRRR